MKFLYKIHSGYDGFTPRRVPERLTPEGLLPLGWTIYLDVIDRGREVWVFFHGPHAFQPGVYIKGLVHRVERQAHKVYLRLKEFSTDRPLTDPRTSRLVGEVVAHRYRQVFVLPEELEPSPDCTLAISAKSCVDRQCLSCRVWKSLPIITQTDFTWPLRLSRRFRAFVPAYWVIPSRCFLHSVADEIAKPVRQTSEVFYRFKVGQAALAYPLASAMYEALSQNKRLDHDYIVPIPLSPDKAARKEIHRTRLLAHELGDRLGVEVRELLTLREPLSKRLLQSVGYTVTTFERRYREALEVEHGHENTKSILLVDDVCTRGSTLSVALERILTVYPTWQVNAATAGLMITKDVVVDLTRLVA